MSLVGSTNEEKIWNFLKGKGLNDYGTAGLLGNMYAESGLNPSNMENAMSESWALRMKRTLMPWTMEHILIS